MSKSSGLNMCDIIVLTENFFDCTSRVEIPTISVFKRKIPNDSACYLENIFVNVREF